MKHGIIENIPNNPKEILDAALFVSYENWVDEKDTIKNPSVFQRKPSSLTYEEAFKLIQSSKPHWVISYRNDSYINPKLQDYWEFGGCNIGSNEYGSVFIWIKVSLEEAEILFEKYKLKVDWY